MCRLRLLVGSAIRLTHPTLVKRQLSAHAPSLPSAFSSLIQPATLLVD